MTETHDGTKNMIAQNEERLLESRSDLLETETFLKLPATIERLHGDGLQVGHVTVVV